jgi:hypothetical protein
MSPDTVASVARSSGSRLALWTDLINLLDAPTVAEIGVYRGAFASHILDNCPSISTYYMIDPWRHLEDWNKPANRADDTFAGFYDETLRLTAAHHEKRVILRGRTSEVIDDIADGELDFTYIDGDHTLRGITIDLVRAWPKVRPGGFIGGDDFRPSIWQHKAGYEPTLVFPFAVYFAQAVGAVIYALPHRQFLIERRDDGVHEFVDLTGLYGQVDLLPQFEGRRGSADPQPRAEPSSMSARLHRWANRLR